MNEVRARKVTELVRRLVGNLIGSLDADDGESGSSNDAMLRQQHRDQLFEYCMRILGSRLSVPSLATDEHHLVMLIKKKSTDFVSQPQPLNKHLDHPFSSVFYCVVEQERGQGDARIFSELYDTLESNSHLSR